MSSAVALNSMTYSSNVAIPRDAAWSYIFFVHRLTIAFFRKLHDFIKVFTMKKTSGHRRKTPHVSEVHCYIYKSSSNSFEHEQVQPSFSTRLQRRPTNNLLEGLRFISERPRVKKNLKLTACSAKAKLYHVFLHKTGNNLHDRYGRIATIEGSNHDESKKKEMTEAEKNNFFCGNLQ